MSERSGADGGDAEEAFDPVALAERLASDELAERVDAAEDCAKFADADPDRATELAGPLIDTLDDEMVVVEQRAADAVGLLAEERPEAVTDAADPLIEIIAESVPRSQVQAARALRPIAAARPESCADSVDRIVETLAAPVTAPLDPTEDVPRDSGTRDTLVNAAETEKNHQYAARGVLANVMVAVAEERPAALAPLVGDVAALLDADEAELVGAAADAIAAVAEHDPDAAREAVPALTAALDHEDASARARAIAALGHVGDPDAVDPLEDVAAEDENEDVSDLAAETAAFLADRQRA